MKTLASEIHCCSRGHLPGGVTVNLRETQSLRQSIDVCPLHPRPLPSLIQPKDSWPWAKCLVSRSGTLLWKRDGDPGDKPCWGTSRSSIWTWGTVMEEEGLRDSAPTWGWEGDTRERLQTCFTVITLRLWFSSARTNVNFQAVMAGLNVHIHFFSKLHLNVYFVQSTGWGFRVKED